MEAFNALSEIEGVDREVAVFSIEQRIDAFRTEYTKEGGCDNAAIERIFPLMTYL